MPSKKFLTSVYQLIQYSCAGILISALLTACGPSNIKTQTTTAAVNEQRLMPLEKLRLLSEPQKTAAAVANAELAAARQKYNLAENYLLLATLTENNISSHEKALLTAGQLAIYTSQLDLLSEWFELNTSSDTPTILINHFELNKAIRTNDNNSIVSFGLQLSDERPLDQSTAEVFWGALQSLNLATINSLLNQQTLGGNAMGWASFAAAYLNNGGTLQAQAATLEAWQNQWPNHYANTIAANDIAAIKQQASSLTATAVAVIPLSGRLSNAGKAIQAAMLAAHLERPQFAELIFLNSSTYDTTEALLNDINRHQPSVIIGPIDKNKAQALASHINRTAPLVSLNAFTLESPSANPSYQLGLNIEDEADYLATAAPADYTRALLVSTQSNLAVRARDAFAQEWTNREESDLIIAALEGSANFSSDIERHFLLTDSQSRQEALENIFIQQMESNPRRRQDIDVIFLSATADQARAINPLLAYHYAGDLPVLSPSIVFDGLHSNVKNNDLDGIIFSDTPWSIHSSKLKSSMQYHSQNGGAPSKNLHALGIDAYFFAARIGIWKNAQAQSFNGLSGQRLIAPSGKTKRRPALAKITKNGIIPQLLINE